MDRRLFSSLCGLVAFGGAASSAPAPTPQRIPHDPRQPHRAWLFAIDTSHSMRATQFTKLKRIFGRLIATEIATNDLVWLVPVAGQHQEATPYPMPRAGVTRSERAAALQQLQDDKEKLQNAIVKLVQRASNTDLKKPSNTRSTSCKGNGAPAHAC